MLYSYAHLYVQKYVYDRFVAYVRYNNVISSKICNLKNIVGLRNVTELMA